MVIESPTANQPSNCMKKPVSRSIRNRCSAKPTSRMNSDAPATALVPPKPEIFATENRIASPYGGVADARLDERHDRRAPLEPHDDAARGVLGVEVTGLEPADEKLRQPLRRARDDPRDHEGGHDQRDGVPRLGEGVEVDITHVTAR